MNVYYCQWSEHFSNVKLERLSLIAGTSLCQYAGYIDNQEVLNLETLWLEGEKHGICLLWTEDMFICHNDIESILSIMNDDIIRLEKRMDDVKKNRNHHEKRQVKAKIVIYETSSLIKIMINANNQKIGLICLSD